MGGMLCYYCSKSHISLILVCIIVGIDSLTSSTTDCNCPSEIPQNVKCTKQTNCTQVCYDGYWGKDCQYGRTRLTSSSGYITDGHGDYRKVSKHMWLIDAENKVNATIHFKIEEFVTECNWDYLYIFDGDSTYSPLLAAFNGHFVADVNSTGFSSIPQEIIAKSGKAFIYFFSDLGISKLGFNISYRIIDKCPCVNGRCNTAGLCICEHGWSGSLCDVRKNCSYNCINSICNQTLGSCICSDGFTGNDCSQPITSSYWNSVKEFSGVEISPRSSHAAAIIGEYMWVYCGFRFSHPKEDKHKQMYRYHLKDKTWTNFDTDEINVPWGHSMIAYKDKLIVFGGETDDGIIVNKLAVFDTNSSEWSYPTLNYSSQAVSGHTATLVDDKMIVIWGLSADGLFPRIQEYDIVKSTWEVIESTSAIQAARYGHTSVYDDFSKRIYVYGGASIDKNDKLLPVDSLMAYYPYNRTWITLASSNFPQILHSAVIIDRMMVVYGGNPYDHDNNVFKCHSAKLHVYDLACQKWYSEDLPVTAATLARYGHTAVAKERTMYVFGGFNGALFNDILTYTHGDCKQILNKTECTKKYFSSGCYWENNQCRNKDNATTLLQCPAQYEKLCSEIKSCDECTANSKCGWDGQSCKAGGNNKCPKVPVDICPLYVDCKRCNDAKCLWTGKKCERKTSSINPAVCPVCNKFTSSKQCLSSSKCVWCENLLRCVDERLYTIYYPYGQCLEWTSNQSGDKDIACESKHTCRDCLTLPSCGWNESEMRNGAGECLEGSASGPKDRPWRNEYWYFFDCPLCQCNGHSSCPVNSSVCLQCRNNTTGKNCERCASGYFGTPANGQTCNRCECNGHGDTCNKDGVCTCNMRGVEGKNCEKCAGEQYEGNATDGGYCYYKLQPDYLYKINVSSKTIFNFICSPHESDKDTIVTVDILKGNSLNPALLNISVGSDEMPEVFLLSNVVLSTQYEEKFSKDHYPFGSNNFYFKIYVYNLKPFSTVSISVHQPNNSGINLLQFFIIFLACFVGLLLIAVVFWKAKSFFDTFRRTRRRNVELVYMTNRPFASVPICVDRPGHVPMKTKPSPLTTEICYGSKAAVVTVLVRLPVCAQTESSTGAASLCLGSTLVNYNEHQGSKMVNYMKNIKRRRNPFRSSST